MSWSGKTMLYKHKHGNWRDHPVTADDLQRANGVKRVVMLDVQWSTCPVEVADQVKKLWSAYELGNDKYMIKTTISNLIEEDSVEYPTNLIVDYLREHEIGDADRVIIHFWW